MIKQFIFFSSIILLVACGKSKFPSDVLKPDKMQAVLWDVLQADAFTFGFQKKDSSKNTIAENVRLQKQVFLIHHTSKDAFYKSYDFYKTHPDLMKILLDSMINKANRNKVQLILIKPSVKRIVKDSITSNRQIKQ